ncbi:ferritin-like fold-containing protein [Cellulomonas soli]|uniref:ferritin-like fold-containing protein n=1 Tax=Cellulomonas soli TaxID=931535 RepID=UPI003F834992
MTATPAETADAVELLGLVAQLEHLAFARLAADAAVAPTAEHRIELSRFAAAAVARRDRVLDRVAELGADPLAAMALYDGVLDDFDARTEPNTWWERLLTVYVGYGVADDFCRLAAAGLDETSRALVVEVLDDAEHADLAVAELDAAGTDTAVSARLALWGRRLVGEALGVVQRLVVQRPGLVRLLDARPTGESTTVAGQDTAAPGAAGQSAVGERTQAPANQASSKLFGELTAQHTRRMTRLGLTA